MRQPKFKKYPALQIVLSMARSKDNWIDDVCHILRGALKEFSKQKFSELVGYRGHDWNSEIKSLFMVIQRLLDPRVIKTTSKFNREKAFQEAFRDALGAGQSKVVEAKNILATRHNLTGAQYDLLQRTIMTADDLLPEMVEKFLPGVKINR
jgi:predicted component of type VI protein secretion system